MASSDSLPIQRVKRAIARLKKIKHLHFDIVADVFQSVANVARRGIVAVAKGRRQDENLLHSWTAKYHARVTTGWQCCELLLTFPAGLFTIWISLPVFCLICDKKLALQFHARLG